MFLTDYSEQELKICIQEAYKSNNFSHADIAPIVTVNEKMSVLELWHGPTAAFKDMALQLLPRLLTTALKKLDSKDEIVILTATSGDTGKAALAGFKDVEQTKIIVFYPRDGVSTVQKLQMVTQEGNNTFVVSVDGNFDDAQNGVKDIFNNKKFNAELAKKEVQLSSANSINWGRLVPQIVYYFSAYADLVKQGVINEDEPINFVVPTGNFGNILAGYYAWQMGLPVNKLVCAANSNNVLADFLQTGRYNKLRPFFKTLSPSMDILISSNLERLLYHVVSGDTVKVARLMDELNHSGLYDMGRDELKAVQELFWSGWVDDSATVQTIKTVSDEYDYVCDPHTAVAWRVAEDYRAETGDAAYTVILSTASPFKFNTAVLEALGVDTGVEDEFVCLRMLSEKSGWKIPNSLAELADKKILHTKNCRKDEMITCVRDFL